MIKTMTPQVDACAESDQSRQSIWELARKLELKLQKYVPQDDFFDACAERDSLASQLAEKEAECLELRKRFKDSPTAQLNNICAAMNEHLGESPYTQEEWDRIDKENTALKAEREGLREVIYWALGERGPFPDRPEGWDKMQYKPWYWWRTELRQKLDAAITARKP